MTQTPPSTPRSPLRFYERLKQWLRLAPRRASVFRESLPQLPADARHRLDGVDRLTGLPNHPRFVQTLERRAAGGERFAVVVLRFSNLRRLTSTLGCDDADAVARLFAQRLAAQSEFGENLARVTPTEFACTLALRSGEVPASVDAAARVRAALAACAGDVVLAGVTVQPQLHGGIAVFPEDGDTVSELLDRALTTAARAAQTHDPRQVLLHAAQARQAALQSFHRERAGWAAPSVMPMTPVERTDVLNVAH